MINGKTVSGKAGEDLEPFIPDDGVGIIFCAHRPDEVDTCTIRDVTVGNKGDFRIEAVFLAVTAKETWKAKPKGIERRDSSLYNTQTSP